MLVLIPTTPWTYLGRGQFSPEEDILAWGSRGPDNCRQVFSLTLVLVSQ